eukprot:TRINITY_DN37054_c0_g1_i1.p1 TRINITY_DN37054_c0_g1~~TRINITY_DN37054_c0_g1_i1.p1  ORF type:complete len:759 (-),score=92.06 TRINITY_DN37054_c0_g1_i1:82-2286(-)
MPCIVQSLFLVLLVATDATSEDLAESCDGLGDVVLLQTSVATLSEELPKDKGDTSAIASTLSASAVSESRKSSPTIDLAVVLISICSAIMLGYVCKSNGFISPGAGDTKGLRVFTGSIAFPALVFNTVATAELGSINFGVVFACSLAKLIIFWSIWIISYFAFLPGRAKGQRVLTSTVFAFFAISSDDFATGFPVIDALYGPSMTVYIAANSTVGSLLMVPMTLVMLEIGKGLLQERDGQNAGRASLSEQAFAILQNITFNPVIVMTCAGLVFQLFFGSSLVPDGPGTARLPEPLASIVELWSGPFSMLALMSTGLSLTSASLRFWPMLLVVFKLVVCGYLSYALGLAFIKDPLKRLHDFTFFYGCIPTSSAPLVLAQAFDPGATEIIASAVLFGYVLAAPNMIVTALFLSEEFKDMTFLVNTIQSTVGLLSAVSAGLCLLFFAITRKSWKHAGGTLALYAAAVFCYGLMDFYLSSVCQETSLQEWQLVLFNWLQKLCALLTLYLQVLLATNWTTDLQKRWETWLAISLASVVLAFFTHPVALDQLCHLHPSMQSSVGTVIWSILLCATVLALTLWAIYRNPHSSSHPDKDEQVVQESDSTVALHPEGIVTILCLAQGLRAFMQVVNSSDFLSSGNDITGGRVELLIIEQSLEVGQGVVLFVALLAQGGSTSGLRLIADNLKSFFAKQDDRSDANLDDSIAIFPDLSLAVRAISEPPKCSFEPTVPRRTQTIGQ